MVSVLLSYLKFHYGRAYIEGIKMLAGHPPAIIFVGIPLFIVWTLLPFLILLFAAAGFYLIFLWNSL